MIQYHISYKQAETRYINLILTLENTQKCAELHFDLPAWRPGRYEIQNFSKNIRHFKAYNANKDELYFTKANKDQWKVQAIGEEKIEVHYQYYANQLDAGGTYVDEQQLYINFITCIFQVREYKNESYQVQLGIPKDYKLACSLLEMPIHTIRANSFHELVDCPLIASKHIVCKTYQIAETKFHIWVNGPCQADWDKIIYDFTRFSKEQIALFEGSFSKNYHFLIQLVPYQYYHGVEHANSTVIVIGPGSAFQKKLYTDVLGISSHELFHAWNACRIRPKELVSYDYQKENYFKTGFVLEGITTYYGDYMLARSQVFDEKQYFSELNQILDRHFRNEGRHYLSLADSSWDLWLDGYDNRVPGKKVSIYMKGALISFILDMEIRRNTKDKRSLDDLLRLLWHKYGKANEGYDIVEFKDLAEQIAKKELHNFFDDCIYGTVGLEQWVKESFEYVGCELQTAYPIHPSEQIWGFKTLFQRDHYVITQIAPSSPASLGCSIDDEIIAVNGIRARQNNLEDMLYNQENIALCLSRKDRLVFCNLKVEEEKQYFKSYKIKKNLDANEQQKQSYQTWLKKEF